MSSTALTSPVMAAFGGLVNVVSGFGADPTGALSASAALQSAINYVSANYVRGKVVVPAGAQLLLDATVTFKPNVILEGYGAQIRQTAPVGFAISQTTQGFVNCGLMGVEIVGAADAVTSFQAVKCDGLLFKDVTWTGVGTIWDLDRCSYMTEAQCINKGSPYRPAGRSMLYSSVYTGNGDDYCTCCTITDRKNINIGNGFRYQVIMEFTRCVAAKVVNALINDGRTGNNASYVATDGCRGAAFYGDCQGSSLVKPDFGNCYDGVFFGKNLRASGDTGAPTFCSVLEADFDGCRRAAIAIVRASWCEFMGGRFTGYSSLPDNAVAILSNVPSTDQSAGAGNWWNKFCGLTIDGYQNNGGTGALFSPQSRYTTFSSSIFSNCKVGLAHTGTSADVGWNAQGNSFLLCATGLGFNPGAPGGQNMVKNNLGAVDVT